MMHGLTAGLMFTATVSYTKKTLYLRLSQPRLWYFHSAHTLVWGLVGGEVRRLPFRKPDANWLVARYVGLSGRMLFRKPDASDRLNQWYSLQLDPTCSVSLVRKMRTNCLSIQQDDYLLAFPPAPRPAPMASLPLSSIRRWVTPALSSKVSSSAPVLKPWSVVLRNVQTGAGIGLSSLGLRHMWPAETMVLEIGREEKG